jgi:sulfite reductase (NADPH) flavoprotein alpha-component
MLRQFHKLSGLLAALLVTVLALSGAVLSAFPALDRAGAVMAPTDAISVADLAGRIADHYPSVEQIRRTPSGKVIAFHFENGAPASIVVDPVSGQAVADYAPPALERWMTNLHRSLFLDDAGRMVAGLGALAMALLVFSGLQITARHMGGWRRVLGRARGSRHRRLHVDFGRPAATGLMLSALTGIYMSLSTFGVVPDGSAQAPGFPEQVAGGPAIVVDRIEAFRDIGLSDLRELTFPYPDDPTDAYGIKTATGEGYVDQATGQMLVWQEYGLARQVHETIYRLHTGQGLWWLGLLLGLAALAVPVMSVTGMLVWASGRRGRPRIEANVPARAADTVILVGSEGGSTWGFARTLHDALTATGHKVHTAPMDSLAPRYRAASRMFILTATYGDGAAPRSARRFLARLEAMDAPAFPVAVLGFGDRRFPRFCRFAQDVEQALLRKGWASFMPLATIDRQSAQAFARWGTALSEALGEAVTLTHVPARPRSHTLTLLTRRDYGEAVQAPTSILRFAVPRSGLLARLTGRAFPRFAAGDLLGILPPGSDIPRYYSLASSSRDGVLEICVRKHPGGLCSGHLHGLRPGATIDAFIRSNPEFRPASGRKPVILIGAGTGMGPLAGFIRANRRRRPVHLYFGGRDPGSDYLYEDEIATWLGDKRLSSVTTAFSRVAERVYVQDRIRENAEALRTMIAQGAQVMVCGGRNMADGVRAALEEVLIPLGLTAAALKAQGRYAEDVY